MNFSPAQNLQATGAMCIPWENHHENLGEIWRNPLVLEIQYIRCCWSQQGAWGKCSQRLQPPSQDSAWQAQKTMVIVVPWLYKNGANVPRKSMFQAHKCARWSPRTSRFTMLAPTGTTKNRMRRESATQSSSTTTLRSSAWFMASVSFGMTCAGNATATCQPGQPLSPGIHPLSKWEYTHTRKKWMSPHVACNPSITCQSNMFGRNQWHPLLSFPPDACWCDHFGWRIEQACMLSSTIKSWKKDVVKVKWNISWYHSCRAHSNVAHPVFQSKHHAANVLQKNWHYPPPTNRQKHMLQASHMEINMEGNYYATARWRKLLCNCKVGLPVISWFLSPIGTKDISIISIEES